MSILFSQKLLENNEIRPQDSDFTEVLCSIALKPKRLYFYGKMPENRPKTLTGKSSIKTDKQLELRFKKADLGGQKNALGLDDNDAQISQCRAKKTVRPKVLAIVGSRKPTIYGAEIARKLAFLAAKRGAIVVSGLAYGIDSIAHRGALEAGGTTVAVLGTPIDQIYPRSHIGLAEEIVESGGCVMSERAPGTKYHGKTCFLERNRLIAGLADVVVIPEAAERSGSLNTAAHALEQGREIFAMPGNIDRPMSKGCNRLLRQGAMPYLEPEDVLDVLFPHTPKRRRLPAETIEGETEIETMILRVLATGVRDGEEILALTGVEVAEFNQNLTMLELKGRVLSLGANRWALKA